MLSRHNEYRNEILYNSQAGEMRVYFSKNHSSVSFSESFLLTTDPHCSLPDASGTLSIPNSAAFIDLDGDCMPDLFLTKEVDSGKLVYEVYIQRMVNGQQKYCFVQTDTLPENTMIEFADVDRDGMVDMLFVTGGTTLHTLYNLYTALPATETNLCHAPYATDHLQSTPLFARMEGIGE